MSTKKIRFPKTLSLFQAYIFGNRILFTDLALDKPPPACYNKAVISHGKKISAMQNRAYHLLKSWCDTLLTYRVSLPHPLLDGALLCPVCHVVHGRIADLVFPLSLLYVRTGEHRYLEAADTLLDWTDRNLSRPDGSLRNDAGNEWKEPANFTAIAVSEALYRYGDALPREVYDRWMKLFVRISDYVNTIFIDTVKTVINYSAGAACEQAFA